MLLSDTARSRARALSGVASGLSALVAAMAYFGMNDGDWTLVMPMLFCLVAAVWPTRIVVGSVMLAMAAIVLLGLDGPGVLFAASLAALMLALNNLQAAATRVRRRQPAQ